MSLIETFKLFLSLFFKNKLLAILFGVFFVLVQMINAMTFQDSHNFLGAYRQIFLIQELLFAGMILFLFLSYEYFYEMRKANLSEVLTATKRGVLQLHLFQFLVMVLLNVVITLSYGFYSIALYFHYGFQHPDFFTHILLNVLLLFLIQNVTILLGWALALVFKRLVSYLIAIGFIFLGTVIFEGIADEIMFGSRINLYPIYDFFSFNDPAFGWSTNFHVGFSVLPDRFWQLLIWMTMLSAMIAFKLIRKKTMRHRVLVTSFALLAVSVYFYQQPMSRFTMNGNPDGSLMYDHYHYEDREIPMEAPDFNVLAYDLDLVVRNQLYVTARLTVDEQLSEYRFTLYHRYLITSVTNQDGEAMAFVQEGDYFTVYNTDENLEAIIMEYVGYSPRFYSNRQGMMLPGFFPYFPHAGFHPIFCRYDLDGFEGMTLPEDAYFSLSITGAGQVFSNLEEVAPNQFSGRTRAVTLVSGFLNQQVIEGVTVIYPFLHRTEFNDELLSEHIHHFIRDFSDSDAIQTVIVMPNLNLHHLRQVLHSDHVTAQGLFYLAEESYQSLLNPRALFLQTLIDEYLNDRELFDHDLAFDLSHGIEGVHFHLQARIEELGLERFLELATLYMEDRTDRRTPYEFLQDIGEEE